jgi:hypothetical protein
VYLKMDINIVYCSINIPICDIARIQWFCIVRLIINTHNAEQCTLKWLKFCLKAWNVKTSLVESFTSMNENWTLRYWVWFLELKCRETCTTFMKLIFGCLPLGLHSFGEPFPWAIDEYATMFGWTLHYRKNCWFQLGVPWLVERFSKARNRFFLCGYYFEENIWP